MANLPAYVSTGKDNNKRIAQVLQEMLKKNFRGVISMVEFLIENMFSFMYSISMIRSPKVAKSRLWQLNNACSLTTEYSL